MAVQTPENPIFTLPIYYKLSAYQMSMSAFESTMLDFSAFPDVWARQKTPLRSLISYKTSQHIKKFQETDHIFHFLFLAINTSVKYQEQLP